MDKTTKKALQQYAKVFHDSRQRNVNEADTVTFLTRFLTDVLGYDVFSEITKEFQIRDRYCDIALKVDGEVRLLIEAKAAGNTLSDRHIEQAENYASRSGLQWVILTNGTHWKLYHLTFDSGIEHDVAFDVTLTPDCNFEEAWALLSLLSRNGVAKGKLAEFWEQKKTLRPSSLVRAVFTEDVMNAVRKELKRKSGIRLELTDIGEALKKLLNPDVLIEDIKIQKKRRKKKKLAKTVKFQEDGQKNGEVESDELEDTNLESSENEVQLASKEGAEFPESQSNGKTE